MAIYSKEYITIINKNKADKDIEIFWYNYKNCILNIYRNYFRDSSDDIIIQNELTIFSGILNVHQEKMEWSSIITKIRNFQIFGIFFILGTLKKNVISCCIFNNIFIMYIKFLKRWNKIEMVDQFNKIPLKNWNCINKEISDNNPDYLSDIVKICITIVIIGKNMQIRKYDGFLNILSKLYYFDNYWVDKNNYKVKSLSIFPMINIFFTRCVPLFLFDMTTGKIDAIVLTLDYISYICNFKEKWFKNNADKVPPYYKNNLSTKKFCNKLKLVLKVEDFE